MTSAPEARFGFAADPFDLLPLPAPPAAVFCWSGWACFSLRWCSSRSPDSVGAASLRGRYGRLSSAAGQASGIKGNRWQSPHIRHPSGSLMGERILGLGSNDCRNPILRRAGVLLNGARRIRTADLLGAIQALCQLSYSPGLCGHGKLVPLPRKRQDNRIVFESLPQEWRA